MANTKQATEAQKRFCRDLVKDLKRLFLLGKPVAYDADFYAWLGGVCKRHAATLRDAFLTGGEDAEQLIDGLTSYQAWRLIGAWNDIRDRMEAKLPREVLQTPRPLLAAIWKAVGLQGMDRDMVEEIVWSQTDHETSSTKQLRRAEAIAVLRRVGGSTRVFEMTPPKREGGRPGFRERDETRI